MQFFNWLLLYCTIFYIDILEYSVWQILTKLGNDHYNIFGIFPDCNIAIMFSKSTLKRAIHMISSVYAMQEFLKFNENSLVE